MKSARNWGRLGMKYEWQSKKIGDVVDIRRGASPRPIHKFLANAGMPWVKIADATSDSSRYLWKTNEYIIDEGINKSVVVEPETLIVSNSATPGLPKIMKIRACVHDGWLVFTNYRGVTRDFLYYKFIDIRRKLVNQANGSVFQNLKTDIVKDFDIDIPSIRTQNKIVDILSKLDEKIELNNAINNNLSEQIKTICTAWLSDYAPFGGVLPDDWSKTSLSSIADFVSGYSYKGTELTESNIAMATIKNFDRKGGFKLDGYKEIVPSSKLKDTQHTELFDTLVAHTDLTQNAEVIGNAEPVMSKSGYSDIVFSMDLVKVVPKNKHISKFLIAAILQDKKFKAHCLGYVNGTTVLHLSKKALPEYQLYLPNDLSALKPLDELVTALYQQISANIEEITKLEALRNTILPKLMSGELDVSDIDL